MKIIIAGLGIKFYSHITQEVLAAIKGTAKLFYLVNEPIMVEWLESEVENACSLDEIYFSSSNRYESYKAIASEVVSALDVHSNACLAVYGHPLMLNQITENIISLVEDPGCVSILPGVSSDSVMFCDLGINPIRHGLQSYEATSFVFSKPVINLSANLVLWQPGVVGVNGQSVGHDASTGISIVYDALINCGYKPSRVIYFYEASLYPHKPPTIIKTTIKDMVCANISTLMTIFIPSDL